MPRAAQETELQIKKSVIFQLLSLSMKMEVLVKSLFF